MALWEYKCSNKKCGKTFEKILHVKEPQYLCPDCGHVADVLPPKPSPFQWGHSK